MSGIQSINIGTYASDPTADSLPAAFGKVNNNFNNLPAFVPTAPVAALWPLSIARTVQQRLSDTLNIKDFGAVGDGTSHTLSSIGSITTAIGKFNTGGWSVAQWQQIFPCANALTNQIDWCAFQTAVNTAIIAAPANIWIQVPQGQYLFDQAVTGAMPSGLKLMITGAMEGSTIVVNNSAGGIILTSSTNLAVLLVDQMCFLAGQQNSGTALGFTGNKNASQTRRLATIKHLFIGSINDATDACFDVGLALSGVSRPFIQNVFVDQGSAATHKMAIGIQFDYCYNSAISYCDVHVRGTGGSALGYSHVGDVQQGGRMYGCQAVACDTGAIVAYNAGSNEPDFHIIHCHFNSNNIGLIIDGIKYGWITNNEMYCQNPGSPPASYVDILVRSCEGLQILNNIYRQNFQTTRYHVRLDVTGSLQGSAASIRGILIDDRDGYFAATVVPPVYVNNTPAAQTRTLDVTIVQSAYIASYDFASYPAWPLYKVVSGDGGVTTNSPNNVLAKNELPHVTTVTASSYVADPFIDEEIIWVNRAGAVTINLPALSNVPIGKKIIVKDLSGAAGTNHITLNPGANTIDGAASLVISTNYGFSVLSYVGTGSDWSVI